jgi:hypothetical protein
MVSLTSPIGLVISRQGECGLALIEALRLKLTGFFWAPLVRAAVLG